LEVRGFKRFWWAWELRAADIQEMYGNYMTCGNVLPKFAEHLHLTKTVKRTTIELDDSRRPCKRQDLFLDGNAL
jgi:hypothetical protein